MLAKGVLQVAQRLPRGGFPLVRFCSRLLPELRSVPIRPNAFPQVVLYADLSQSVWYPLWKYGCYPHQKGEELVWNRILTRDMTVFDVGANIGYTAAFFAKCCPEGLVVAFEPSPRCRAYLEHVARIFPNVRVVAAAVGDRIGEVQFDERENLDRSRIDRKGSLVVSLVTIDSYCIQTGLKPDFLKVDAEGADAQVLRGAVETLRHHTRYVMFEALEKSSLQACIEALSETARSWIVERVAHNGETVSLMAQMSNGCLTNNYLARRVA